MTGAHHGMEGTIHGTGHHGDGTIHGISLGHTLGMEHGTHRGMLITCGDSTPLIMTRSMIRSTAHGGVTITVLDSTIQTGILDTTLAITTITLASIRDMAQVHRPMDMARMYAMAREMIPLHIRM